MEHFTYESNEFWCNNEKDGEVHNVVVLVSGLSVVEYEHENGRLLHNNTTVSNLSNVYLSCKTCGKIEEITDKVDIETEDDGITKLYY